MLFTTFNLPEDVHLLAGRAGGRVAAGVRVDARPPGSHRPGRPPVPR